MSRLSPALDSTSSFSQRPSISSTESGSRRPSVNTGHNSSIHSQHSSADSRVYPSSPASGAAAGTFYTSSTPASGAGIVFPDPTPRSTSRDMLLLQQSEQEALAPRPLSPYQRSSPGLPAAGPSSMPQSVASSRQHSIDNQMAVRTGEGVYADDNAASSINRSQSLSSLSGQSHLYQDVQSSTSSSALGVAAGNTSADDRAYHDSAAVRSDDAVYRASGDNGGLHQISEGMSGPATRRASVAIGSGIGIGGVPALEERVAQEQEQMREDQIPVEFDESVLKSLCDMDCGLPLLQDRMKQSMASAHEAANFFKKRAQIEEEYARAMTKLARSSSQSYSMSEGKAGSYVSSWLAMLRTHELVGDNRLKFSAQLAEISEELLNLSREVEKARKSGKDLGSKLERGLQEQDSLVDKARARFDNAAEELERLLILKTGESIKDTTVPHAAAATGAAPNKRSFGKAMSKLKGPKNPAQVARQEEEVRSRMGQSSDAYRSQVLGAQAVRQEYFHTQLPRLLRSMKESSDEVDLGTQYHLSRYSYIFESTLVTDGLTISPVNPEDGPGLRSIIDSIDVRDDFKTFMQQYAISWQMSGQKGPRRDGPGEDSYPAAQRPPPSPTQASSNHVHQTFSRPTFGVDLGDQMLRDSVEVPRILEKCFEAVEAHGLDSMGIYRLSGTTSRVQRLKSALDRDIEGTDLLSEENLSDINDIAAVMKLWFRELPEPLLTWELYHGFIEAAKIENDRLRHIRLHERVNDLPDPNYATLKFLMGHLDKVKQRESINQMTGSNLAIVFGPNLLGQPPSANGQTGTALADMQWQCKVIETILQHYAEIFLDDPEP